MVARISNRSCKKGKQRERERERGEIRGPQRRRMEKQTDPIRAGEGRRSRSTSAWMEAAEVSRGDV